MKSRTTSRERVLAAVARERPGPVVSDLWAEDAAWNRMLRHFGRGDRDRLLDDFDVDVRHIAAKTPASARDGEVYQNMWGERFIMHPVDGGMMREDVPGALRDAATFDEIASFPWPSVDAVDYSAIPDQCERHAGRALMYGDGDVWQRLALSRSFEVGLMDLYDHPEWVDYMGDKYLAYYAKDYARAQESAGGRIDVFMVISDLGSQRGPIMSLEMFDRFVAPRIRAMSDHIHGLGAKTFFHSCGMIHPFIRRFIELGVDILDPIQPVDDLMRPESLAPEFGGRIAFHGGIDVQGVLQKGTPDAVRREVRRYLEAFAGGYICCSAHFLQPDLPVENIAAMYDETLRRKQGGGAWR
jgi:uroporphyrinogen decarboxylase